MLLKRVFPLSAQVDLLPGALEGEALEQLQAIVSSLNPLATVIACQEAKVCGKQTTQQQPHWCFVCGRGGDCGIVGALQF
jgi:hypothetical protein